MFWSGCGQRFPFAVASGRRNLCDYTGSAPDVNQRRERFAGAHESPWGQAYSLRSSTTVDLIAIVGFVAFDVTAVGEVEGVSWKRRLPCRALRAAV